MVGALRTMAVSLIASVMMDIPERTAIKAVTDSVRVFGPTDAQPASMAP